MSWTDTLALAGGVAWLAYVLYEAVRTYRRTDGDDWMTAFHGFASIFAARAIEAAGAVLVIVDSVPALQGYLPDKGVGAAMVTVARVIAQIRLAP